MKALCSRRGTPFVWEWTRGDVLGWELGRRVIEEMFDENSRPSNAYAVIRWRVADAERGRIFPQADAIPPRPTFEHPPYETCECFACEQRRRRELSDRYPDWRGISPHREAAV